MFSSRQEQCDRVSKTSRSPYIGSWCVLFPVMIQFVMAALCFQTLSFNYGFKYAFVAWSPPYLDRLPVWVTLCGFIVWVHCVGHIFESCKGELQPSTYRKSFHEQASNLPEQRKQLTQEPLTLFLKYQ